MHGTRSDNSSAWRTLRPSVKGNLTFAGKSTCRAAEKGLLTRSKKFQRSLPPTYDNCAKRSLNRAHEEIKMLLHETEPWPYAPAGHLQPACLLFPAQSTHNGPRPTPIKTSTVPILATLALATLHPSTNSTYKVRPTTRRFASAWIQVIQGGSCSAFNLPMRRSQRARAGVTSVGRREL